MLSIFKALLMYSNKSRTIPVNKSQNKCDQIHIVLKNEFKRYPIYKSINIDGQFMKKKMLTFSTWEGI